MSYTGSTQTMASRDYLAKGANDVWCQVCGKKIKSFEISRRYDNVLCCRFCYNPRHSSEYPPRIQPELPPSIISPQPAELTLGEGYCELYRRQMIPGIVFPGCALPGSFYGYQVGPILVPNPDTFEPTEFIPEIL